MTAYKEMRMAVPDGKRFPMEFDEVFPESASVVGKPWQ